MSAMLLQRLAGCPMRPASCGARRAACAVRIGLPTKPLLRQRCHNASLVRPQVAAAARREDGSSTSKDDEEEEEEEEGQTFARYCFEGLLFSSLIVGAANLLGQSSNWRWDLPADGLGIILTCALLPTLLLLAICVPAYPTHGAATDPKFLEDVYQRANTGLVIEVGSDSSKGRQLALKDEVKPQTLSTALGLIQLFLARPWSQSRPLPIAGFLLKRTLTEAALECLLRGTVVIGLHDNIKATVAQAESGTLFWVKLLGLANEKNSLAAAGILAMVLLTPLTLFQTKSVQEFARAAVNKPIRDTGMAAMSTSSSTVEFSEQIGSLVQATGVEPAVLSQLMANAVLPSERKQLVPAVPDADELPSLAASLAAISSKASAGDAEAGASGADSEASTSGVAVAMSPDAKKKVLEAETLVNAAYASLKAARTADEVEASSLALLHAANTTGEAALAAIIDIGVSQPKKGLSHRTVTAIDAVQALQVSQKQLKELANEAESHVDDVVREAEFEALIRVRTPEDRLVAQVLGSHLFVCMVAVNAAFVASGSLAVSFGTAFMVRVLPSMIVEVTRQLKQDALARQDGQ